MSAGTVKIPNAFAFIESNIVSDARPILGSDYIANVGTKPFSYERAFINTDIVTDGIALPSPDRQPDDVDVDGDDHSHNDRVFSALQSCRRRWLRHCSAHGANVGAV